MKTRPMIWFQTDRNGNRIAYTWSGPMVRSFRMGLAKADMLVATGQADLLPGHPLKGGE